MTASTTAPIKRALVQQLRSSGALMSAIAGGIHQSIAPRKVKYPFLVYSLLPSSRSYQFGDSFQTYVVADIFAFAVNPVDAENIDSLVASALQDAALSVDGQSLLYCRRISDLSQPPGLDAANRRVFQVGGSYRLITDQN